MSASGEDRTEAQRRAWVCKRPIISLKPPGHWIPDDFDVQNAFVVYLPGVWLMLLHRFRSNRYFIWHTVLRQHGDLFIAELPPHRFGYAGLWPIAKLFPNSISPTIDRTLPFKRYERPRGDVANFVDYSDA
jgi:hypothetical protein